MNKKVRHGLLVLVSFTLLISTVFVYRKSQNVEDLKEVKFGYPVYFVSQDCSNRYSFSYFPVWDKFSFKDAGLTKVYPLNLVMSFLIIFVSIEFIVYVLEEIKFRFKNKK